MSTYTVAVAGASGYAGGEMLRILAAHPAFEVTTVTGDSSAGDRLGKHMPHIPALKDMVIEPTSPEVLNGHDVIVLALPHGVSGALAQKLNAKHAIVDLGADHRLESGEAWSQYYGGNFFEPWVYGMPELIVGKDDEGHYRHQRQQLPDAPFIAGPGCNVTAVTLAFQPALAEGLVQTDDIVADLAVGYSGAGKNLKRTNLLAAEALGSATPYSVGGTHRHIPEIVQNLTHAASTNLNDANTASDDSASADGGTSGINVAFTPILVPMARGILAVVSARLSDKGEAMSDEQIRQIWNNAYQGEEFIELLDPGEMPATANVLGSNEAQVQIAVDRNAKRLYGFAAIDNLNRGTAGQAVQSLNIALGLPEDQGLTTIGVAP
ncbi:N-acetyl-gamma-glutamyl-phosphate reductase [Bifidobacterium sp. ESL0745]|uniref:N-acetyl-gamma-glutamyl-phosphate reductase n=1 Tax=Bifidobacterium sp. ESL0745 TaxID=2983226 RepID=UPI0023F71FA5|nr:N-acetyl-gamma-glutamyl-phosphate reductase [Bifidobacterium sp. ESL0745]MDF7664956.1 N-acetyl-gamma-glutamyl-phosphate reductase [Bifidobacterium sp. ESL0745]